MQGMPKTLILRLRQVGYRTGIFEERSLDKVQIIIHTKNVKEIVHW
jgi:hypothetical protein